MVKDEWVDGLRTDRFAVFIGLAAKLQTWLNRRRAEGEFVVHELRSFFNPSLKGEVHPLTAMAVIEFVGPAEVERLDGDSPSSPDDVLSPTTGGGDETIFGLGGERNGRKEVKGNG